MAWDHADADRSLDRRDAPGAANLTERSTRDALDAVLHGAHADSLEVEDRSPVPTARDSTDDQVTSAPDERTAEPGAGPGAWHALIRSEEARWLRYGHPCVAVELEIIGGDELTSHLGQEAGRRVIERLDQVIGAMTRAADRFESRGAWRMVALLPETDSSGAALAMLRVQQAFSDAMGTALSVRLEFGLAEPAPTGSIAVAFHQAGQSLLAKRRRDQQDRARTMQQDRGSSMIDPAQQADSSAAAASSTDRHAAPDPAAGIDALGRMLARGLITQGEHDAKRSEILDRL